MNIDWNADKYSKEFSFVSQYGSGVMDLLDIKKGMHVLDLGCGNGILTKQLADKGTVALGMDDSEEMLEKARKSYPKITFVKGNATDFSVDHPFDAVFSNAVFHWIDRNKQLEMLKCVNQALKPGGKFVFEFGGHGNCQQIHQAMA